MSNLIIGVVLMFSQKLKVLSDTEKHGSDYIRSLLSSFPCIIHIHSKVCTFSSLSLEVADRVRQYYNFPIHSTVYQQDFQKVIPELFGSPSFVVVTSADKYEVLTGNFRVPQLIALVNCILFKVDKDTGLCLDG